MARAATAAKAPLPVLSSAGLRRALEKLPALRAPGVTFEKGAAEMGAVADRLGRVKAAIAVLEEYEQKLNDLCIASGRHEVEGRLFRAVVSHSVVTQLRADRIRRDMPAGWLKKYTRKTAITRVLVNARKGIALTLFGGDAA